MIRHIVMLKMKEEAEGRSKQGNLYKLRDDLLALVPVIEAVRHMEVGLDVVGSPASYDLALTVDVADLDALGHYRDHPAHQAVFAYIQLVSEGRVSVDYEV